MALEEIESLDSPAPGDRAAEALWAQQSGTLAERSWGAASGHHRQRHVMADVMADVSVKISD